MRTKLTFATSEKPQLQADCQAIGYHHKLNRHFNDELPNSVELKLLGSVSFQLGLGSITAWYWIESDCAAYSQSPLSFRTRHHLSDDKRVSFEVY